jgi:acyl-CoA thioester hydrolase
MNEGKKIDSLKETKGEKDFHEIKIRVCYGDTDKMGVVYYGTYPRFYEAGRNEYLRAHGITYREIEEAGIVWPVRTLNITYLKPAFYDDLLTIRTIPDDIQGVRFKIKTEIYNETGELINFGEVVLVSTNPVTGRAMKPPEWLKAKLSQITGSLQSSGTNRMETELTQ